MAAAPPPGPGGGLDAALEQLRRALAEQEGRLAAERAALESERGRQRREAERLEAARVKVNDGDVIQLNVGGRPIDTTRRTLCLVKDSLLATMFSGRWADSVTRDAAGRCFLDLDPDLFESILAWLRFHAIAGPAARGSAPEPAVPAGRSEAMMALLDHLCLHRHALLDYLCLHRHVPLTYSEAFSDRLRSTPGTAAAGDTLTRCQDRERGSGGGGGSGASGGGAARPARAMLVAAGLHTYFDTQVDLTLEIISFGHSMPDTASEFAPQFLGFMPRAALEGLDLGDPSCRPTWAGGCYGWWTGGGRAFPIYDGSKARHPCHEDGLLWHQGDHIEGDHIELTLDCRRSRRHCLITLHNTITGQQLHMETAPQRPRGSGGGGGGAAAPATAAAPVASAPVASAPAAAGAAAAGAAAAGAAEARQQERAARNSTLSEWVLVVGLSRPGDKVRIHRARRRGMPPDAL
ncbi:MAG: hypothetical protein J3K34DRAFT_486353 [Monoraphidium minutum]|nr:MAG: hypothetical protein J3K34DRAFT_486353 [Monoraphidium minutum]